MFQPYQLLSFQTVQRQSFYQEFVYIVVLVFSLAAVVILAQMFPNELKCSKLESAGSLRRRMNSVPGL
jgi:hypothetical protein